MKSNINQKIKSFLKVIQLHKNESTLIKSAVKNNREAQHVLYEYACAKNVECLQILY